MQVLQFTGILELYNHGLKAETGCYNKSPRVACENHCRCDRILLLRSVAQIQTGLNSCDVSQRQNKCKQPCHTVCTHLRQVAATKFKSTNEEASISFSPYQIWTSLLFPLPKLITCTEQVSYCSDLSQDQCRRGDLSPWCVAAICCIVCLGIFFNLRFKNTDSLLHYESVLGTLVHDCWCLFKTL